MKQPFTREQRTTIIYCILGLVLILVILQLWLLTATMNAYLGGDDAVILPAALASLVCFLLNAALIRYLYVMERPGVAADPKARDLVRSECDSLPPSPGHPGNESCSYFTVSTDC
jgi:hypothetical protein